MKLIAIALFVFNSYAYAAEVPAAKSESKTLELPDFSNLQQPATANKDGVGFSADMNCKTTDGQSFQSSEAGYESCMANQKGKAQ